MNPNLLSPIPALNSLSRTLSCALLLAALMSVARLAFAQPFTDTGAGLTGVRYSSVAWGDYDNDGDLIITGDAGEAEVFATLYRNDGGSFTDAGAGLTSV